MSLFAKYMLSSKKNIKEIVELCGKSPSYCSDKNIVHKFMLKVSGYNTSNGSLNYSELFKQIFEISSKYSLVTDSVVHGDPYGTMKNSVELRKYIAKNGSILLLRYLNSAGEFKEETRQNYEKKYSNLFKRINNHQPLQDSEITDAILLMNSGVMNISENKFLRDQIQMYYMNTSENLKDQKTLF